MPTPPVDESRRIAQLKALLAQRIVCLDGAMGTMLQSRKLDEAGFRGARFNKHPRTLQGNYDLLTLTQPGIVADIHRAYIEAGADIIETNTFNSNSPSQAAYSTQAWVGELNRQGAALARALADEHALRQGRPIFVAGALGPTTGCASHGHRHRVTFDELLATYRDACRGLMAGGADLLMVETVIDLQNAKAALTAASQVFEEAGSGLPIIVSCALTDVSGRLRSGETLEEFWKAVRPFHPLAVGLNCSPDVRAVRPPLEALAQVADACLCVCPSAGPPQTPGGCEVSPREMAEVLGRCAADGLLNMVGGCCGTAPAHIRQLAQTLKGCRRMPAGPSLHRSA